MSGVVLANLCDEALTFHWDGQLLGFCPDEPEEPFGDDHQTRLAVLTGDKDWVEIDEVDTISLDAQNDEVVEVSFEDPRGLRAYFAQLAPFNQRAFIEEAGAFIQMLIGAFSGWTPSVEFILEYIQDELRPLQLAQRARATYEVWKRVQRLGSNYHEVDSDERMPAQYGCRVKRKVAVRENENHHEVRLWEIARLHRSGRDSHGKFRVQQSDGYETRKKCRRHSECSLRKKDQNDRRETIRLAAEHFFSFAGKGDGFDEAVDAQLGLQADLKNEAEHASHREWWECSFEVSLALQETVAHRQWLGLRFAFNYPQAMREPWGQTVPLRTFRSDDWTTTGHEDMSDDGSDGMRDDRYADLDDDGYIFADYQGPENSQTSDQPEFLSNGYQHIADGYLDLVVARFGSAERIRARVARGRRA